MGPATDYISQTHLQPSVPVPVNERSEWKGLNNFRGASSRRGLFACRQEQKVEVVEQLQPGRRGGHPTPLGSGKEHGSGRLGS